MPRTREEVFLRALEEERAVERASAERWIDPVALFAPLSEG